MKTKLIFSIVFLMVILLNGQNQRPEMAIMDCIYESYDDEGIALKKLIVEFENKLVEENKLVNSSGTSYFKIVHQMANDSFLPLELFEEFSANWSKIKDPQQIEVGKCREPILGTSLLPFEIQIRELVSKKEVNESLNMALLLSKVLTKEDLELEYFKLKLFVFMAMSAHINNNYVSDEVLPPIYEHENAFSISIDAKNEISLNDSLVNITKLGALLRNYLVKNTSESTILIQYSRDTKYKKYLDLQQTILTVIEELKQEYALEKYSISFDELPNFQKDRVNMVYLVNIQEIEIK